MASSVKFSWVDRSLDSKLDRAVSKANKYMAVATEREAAMTQGRARKRAKWTDRTGNARSGLTTVWEARLTSNGGEFSIDLFHTEKYGYFLEVVKFSRRGDLSIIKRTIDNRGPIFMKTSSKILDRIFA